MDYGSRAEAMALSREENYSEPLTLELELGGIVYAKARSPGRTWCV
jgi:hypothetical protein